MVLLLVNLHYFLATTVSPHTLVDTEANILSAVHQPLELIDDIVSTVVVAQVEESSELQSDDDLGEVAPYEVVKFGGISKATLK